MSTPVQIHSWPGKPTAGRFVYKGRESGVWVWQCDLHDEEDPPPDQWGYCKTWADAMRDANAHAHVCPFVAPPIAD